MKQYNLIVTETEEGVSIHEDNQLDDFVVMGVLTHLVHTRSEKLNNKMKEYERQVQSVNVEKPNNE